MPGQLEGACTKYSGVAGEEGTCSMNGTAVSCGGRTHLLCNNSPFLVARLVLPASSVPYEYVTFSLSIYWRWRFHPRRQKHSEILCKSNVLHVESNFVNVNIISLLSIIFRMEQPCLCVGPTLNVRTFRLILLHYLPYFTNFNLCHPTCYV